MTGIDEALQPILPRELTSISDDVRAVGPPPTPSLTEPYGIRLADPDFDADQVSEWMNRPHLAAAWEYDWPPSRWRRYLRAQLDGAYSRPFIGSLRGRDLGYVELYRAAKDSIATDMRPTPMTSGYTPPSPTRRSSTAASVQSCCRTSWPVSSSANHVAAASCSIRTTETRVRGGCANGPAAPSSVSTIWRTGEWRCYALPRSPSDLPLHRLASPP